jgi:hypothetical protein
MINPFRSPARPPTTIPAAMPAAGLPVAAIAIAVETVVNPTIAPTEMSSPPDTITTVWLMASTPRIVMAMPMLRMLRAEKNTSDRIPPNRAMRISSAKTRLTLWIPTRSIRPPEPPIRKRPRLASLPSCIAGVMLRSP